MYRKSFFMVLTALLIIGLMVSGTKIVSAIPGISNLPSSYDPKLKLEDAVKTSSKPLLVEFYSDACQTCRIVTPWMHKISKKYKNQLTFVMVDVYDPQESQIADIFGVQYIPAIFVFDFKHMHKTQVDVGSYTSRENLDKAVGQAAEEATQFSHKTTSS